LRAFTVALLLAVSLGALSHVAAQDASSDGSQASVDVSCWTDDATGGTACAFTPGPAGAVSWLTVPAAILCAPVLSTGVATWGADGVSQGIDDSNGSIVIAFEGTVSAGGGASYGASLAGVGDTSIEGAGIVCGDDETVGSDDVTDPTEIPNADGTESSPESDDATPTAEDNVDSPPVIQEDPTEAPVDNEVVADTVTVAVYDCSVDPGLADPATVAECLPSEGVSISGTADSVDVGAQSTDASGSVVYTVNDLAALSFTEDVNTVHAGYSPLGSGSVSGTASDGLVLSIVNIGGGRLQIVNGSCPTAGDAHTEFRVIEPQSVTANSVPACEVTPGAAFTISGGGLSGSIVVTTGEDGA